MEDIPWSRIEHDKIEPGMLKLAKAAALVEYNGADYAAYLTAVFADDELFKAAAGQWANEEVQHGEALARYAQLADPDYDFETASRRFSAKIKLPENPAASVRGSRCGELVARCVVEVGTSSYYAALAEASREPVFRQLCTNIAKDEIRHFSLFHRHMKRYRDIDRPSLWERLEVALGRIAESEDDELSYAYYAANYGTDVPYERARFSREYQRNAFRHYRRHHVERAVTMVFQAVGLDPHGRLRRFTSALAYRLFRLRFGRGAA
jgi:hypothetical protein